jgi:hypothetical protein
MAFMLSRRLAVPAWAIAVGLVALSSASPVMLSIAALLSVAVLGLALPAILRWLRRSPGLIEGVPVGGQCAAPPAALLTARAWTRTMEDPAAPRARALADAADLGRMDDDGG